MKLLVAKVNNKDLKEGGMHPVYNDGFIISRQCSDKFMLDDGSKPTIGSKLIGEFRDKGSITSYSNIVAKVPLEFENFLTRLNFKFTKKENCILFVPDVVAGMSSERDNVLALVGHGISSLYANVKEKNIKIKKENLKEELIRMNKELNASLFMVKDNKLLPIKGILMLEDFFWQPRHDNKNKFRIGNISFSYNQAVDGMSILMPGMYKDFMNSINKSKIQELKILGNLKIEEEKKSEISLEDLLF